MIQEAMFLATYNISTTQTISSCRGGVKCSLFFFATFCCIGGVHDIFWKTGKCNAGCITLLTRKRLSSVTWPLSVIV